MLFTCGYSTLEITFEIQLNVEIVLPIDPKPTKELSLIEDLRYQFSSIATVMFV